MKDLTRNKVICDYWQTRRDVLDTIPAKRAARVSPDVEVEGCTTGTRELHLTDYRETAIGGETILGRIEGTVTISDPFEEPPEDTVVTFNGFRWRAVLASAPGLPIREARSRFGSLYYMYNLYSYQGE